MCKMSHIYLKLTHPNYLRHSETLAFLPRLVPDISAFRTANFFFGELPSRALFRAAVHAATHVFSFYPVHQFQDLNPIVLSVLTSLANLPMLFTTSPAANAYCFTSVKRAGKRFTDRFAFCEPQ